MRQLKQWALPLIFAFVATGCKSLGLGGFSTANQALSSAKRSTSVSGAASGGSKASYAARQARSRLNYALKRLEKRCPLDKGPLSKSAMTQCGYAQKGANKTLSKTEAPFQQMDEYKQVSAYLKKLDAKLPEWQQQRAQAKVAKANNKKLSKKFERLHKQHQRVLATLWKVKNGKKTYLKKAKVLRLYVEKLKKFEDFVKWCQTGEYKSIGRSYRWKRSRDPKVACGLSKEWKALYTRYINDMVSRHSKRKESWQRSYMKRLQEKFQLTEIAKGSLSKPQEYVAAQRKAYAPIYAHLGATMPKESFAGLVSIAKDYRKLLRRAARKNRFPSKARFRNGSCRNAFRNAGRSAGLSMVRYGMLFSYWTIKKNRYGLPLRRFRTGMVMFRKRGERHCRIYSLTATAQYRGGGRYATPSSPSDRFKYYTYTVSRCR